VQDRTVRHLLLALPLLAAAACGGGSGEVQGVKKADYLTQAEAICTKANAEQKNLKTPTSASSFAPYVDEVVRIAGESTTALVALTAPTKDKADLDKHVFAPLQKQLAAARTYADAVRNATKANDQTELVKLLSDPPNKTAADLAWMRKYGFKECVEAADTSS